MVSSYENGVVQVLSYPIFWDFSIIFLFQKWSRNPGNIVQNLYIICILKYRYCMHKQNIFVIINANIFANTIIRWWHYPSLYSVMDILLLSRYGLEDICTRVVPGRSYLWIYRFSFFPLVIYQTSSIVNIWTNIDNFPA